MFYQPPYKWADGGLGNILKIMDNRFVYPKFSTFGRFGLRCGGAGLGNLLFTFARTLVLAGKYNLSLINPTWPTIKIGPILRMEKDKRNYFGIFSNQGISGLKKTKKLIFGNFKKEKDFLKNPKILESGEILVVEGLGNYFRDLIEHRNEINSGIRAVFGEKTKQLANSAPSAEVGAHIRLGDFKEENRVSLGWYVSMIEKIRESKPNIRINVFTDGRPEEILDVLRLPGVRLVSLKNPAAELLALSSCNLILGSISTFGAWAVFLGESSVIWGRPFPEVEEDLKKITFSEHIFSSDDLPESVLKKI